MFCFFFLSVKVALAQLEMLNAFSTCTATAADMSRDVMHRRHPIAVANNLMMMPFNDKKTKLNRSISTTAAAAAAQQHQVLSKIVDELYFLLLKFLKERIVVSPSFFFALSPSSFPVCKLLLIWA